MTLKLEAGKKYRTRGGDEVEILKTDLRDEQPIVGIVTHDDGSQSLHDWKSDGSWWPDGMGSDLDLISEIKPERVVWLNVSEASYGGGYFFGSSYPSADKAREESNDGTVAILRVEFEENQYDDQQ